MEVGVGAAQHFVGFFGRRIQADRCVGGVRLGEPFPVAVALDRAGGAEHEMRGRLCAASINEVLEADYIALDIGRWVL